MVNVNKESVQFLLLCLMLALTPFMASGKTVNALLFLEISGLALLALTVWSGNFRGKLSWVSWVTLSFGMLLPVFYLAPVPLSLWSELPGRHTYLPVLEWFIQKESSLPWLGISMIPQKTLHAFLALIPLLAIFLATITLGKQQYSHVTVILLALAAAQAVLGLLQYTTQAEQWFFFGSHSGKDSGEDAVGTYLNRDHYVALMYLMLPLAIGLLSSNIGRRSDKSGFENSIESKVNKSIVLAALVLLLILGGFFSRSRAGIFLILASIIISSFLFAKHIGGSRSTSLATTLGVISIGVASSIGLVPILNRFIALDPMEDGRWKMFETAIIGIKSFFPVGSGPGTFQETYRTIQSIDQTKFINHAHNDYLELFFETGVLGMVLTFFFMISYIHGWIQLKKQKWNQYRFIKVGAGISVLLLLLHSLVDFNLHTPANAAIFTFLLGLFLRKEDEVRKPNKPHNRGD